MAQKKPLDTPVPPLPENEDQRLAALRACAIVGSPREPYFDRLTGLAAKLFDAEMSLISLVEKDRQWFKSATGIDVSETPRQVSFCAHVLLCNSAMVVTDAREDPRFSANPLVTGAPHIRFYAGAPLTTFDGFHLGALCVIDSKPRPAGLSEKEVSILSDLAALVMHEIEKGR
jgi:GAF domain-containing protein